MNGRTLTDAQIARALRAHLPEHAQAGLLERVVTEFAETPQQRPMPTFLAGLFDADPSARRRYQLIAATLLVALTLVIVAGVGAYLERQRQQNALSLEPPTDVRAYVVGAYEGVAELPALTVTIVEVEGTKVRFTYDGVGTLRMDHYFSPNDAEPGMMRLFTNNGMSGEEELNGEKVWVEYPSQGIALAQLAMATGLSTFCATEWEYIGLEYLIARPTHRVTCGGIELWLDVETGLALRSINAQDPDIGPTIEYAVLELKVGPQPAELFLPRTDLEILSDTAFYCGQDPACESPVEPPPPETQPLATPPPAPGDHAVPPDLDAFIAGVLDSHARLAGIEILSERYTSPSDAARRYRDFYDGAGRHRSEIFFDLSGVEPPGVNLTTGGRFYDAYGLTEDGRTIWQDLGPSAAQPGPAVPARGLGDPCVEEWRHEGFDLVAARPAHHLVCAHLEIWVDMEWLLVVRSQRNPDPLDYMTFVWEVIELRIGQPPAELFELPSDAVVCQGRVGDGVCLDNSGNPLPLPSTSPPPSPGD